MRVCNTVTVCGLKLKGGDKVEFFQPVLIDRVAHRGPWTITGIVRRGPYMFVDLENPDGIPYQDSVALRRFRPVLKFRKLPGRCFITGELLAEFGVRLPGEVQPA